MFVVEQIGDVDSQRPLFIDVPIGREIGSCVGFHKTPEGPHSPAELVDPADADSGIVAGLGVIEPKADFVLRRVGKQKKLEAGRNSGGASVPMVETTYLGLSHDPPPTRWLDVPWAGGITIEGLVGS